MSGLVRRALLLLALALPAAADDAAATIGRVDQFLRDGERSKALDLLEGIVARDPSPLEAHVLYQDLLRGSNREAEALARYARRAKESPRDPDARYLHARLLRGDRAVAEYRAVTRLAPAFVSAWIGLARELDRSGKAKAAAAAAETAVKLDPRSREAQGALGWVREQAGDQAGAEAAYRAALQASPDYLPARFDLAHLLARTDRGEAALEQLAEARRSAPHDPQVLVHEGLVLSALGREQEAVERYAKALEGAPSDPLLLVLLAESYAELSEWDLAGKAVDKALRLDPQLASAHAARGYAALLQGRWRPAVDAYAEAARHAPASATLQYYLGLSHERSGDLERAWKCYQAACARDARNASYRLALGSACEATGRLKEALAAYKEATKLDPASPDAWIRLGGVAADLRKPKDAVEALRKARELDPGNVGLLKTLGILHEIDLKQPEQAIAYYRQYVEAGGTDTRVARWLEELEAAK